MDLDFVGFTYNGKHSYRDLKIYRTSNGGRYEENILPTLTEKTASVDGMVGQYYFGTQVGPRTLNISFAFDDVTEAGLQEIKRTFCGDDIHDLIFDEEPYKVYSAKVTGTATVKHLCFDKEGNRRYRGEGSVQFTCYYPYAHSRGVVSKENNASTTQTVKYLYNSESNKYILEGEETVLMQCGVIVKKKEIITLPSYVSAATLYYCDVDGEHSMQCETNACQIQNLSDELVMLTKVTYTLASNLSSKPYLWKDSLAPLYFTIETTQYDYTSKGCFEVSTRALSGKVLNHYNIVDFPTKWQWGQACGLPLHIDDGSNHGEMPAPFVLEATEGEIDKGTRFTVNTNSITVGEKCVGLIWNSKNGLVKATAESDSTTRAILYSGNSISTIPVGASGQATGLNGTTPVAATANFDYWYY